MSEEKNKNDISDFYERYWSAENPAPLTDPTTPERKARLKTAISSLSPGASVLDLGCGRGIFASYLASLGCAARGVDISHTAVAAAAKEFPQIPFEPLRPDLSIPAEAASFEAVWSSEVIEHIFDVHAHLAEINRVLKPGGLYILTTPYHGRLKDVLVSLLKFDAHFDPQGAHIRFFDRCGLTRCLVAAGFEPVSFSGIGRLWKLYRTWFVVAKKVSQPGPG